MLQDIQLLLTCPLAFWTRYHCDNVVVVDATNGESNGPIRFHFRFPMIPPPSIGPTNDSNAIRHNPNKSSWIVTYGTISFGSGRRSLHQHGCRMMLDDDDIDTLIEIVFDIIVVVSYTNPPIRHHTSNLVEHKYDGVSIETFAIVVTFHHHWSSILARVCVDVHDSDDDDYDEDDAAVDLMESLCGPSRLYRSQLSGSISYGCCCVL